MGLKLPIFIQDKILKPIVFHLHMDICHHGFQRESCDLCRLEATNTPPVKIVDDLRQFDLVHPTPRIKDPLSKLILPDLTIQPIQPPDPVVSYPLDPNKQIIDTKRDLITKDVIDHHMEIIDPKKQFLMKK